MWHFLDNAQWNICPQLLGLWQRKCFFGVMESELSYYEHGSVQKPSKNVSGNLRTSVNTYSCEISCNKRCSVLLPSNKLSHNFCHHKIVRQLADKTFLCVQLTRSNLTPRNVRISWKKIVHCYKAFWHNVLKRKRSQEVSVRWFEKMHDSAATSILRSNRFP